MLYGPNTNLAHNSIVFMIESQIRHVMACLARLGSDGVCSIEVKKHIQQHFNARIQQRLQNSIWSEGCTSWYLTAAGKTRQTGRAIPSCSGSKPAHRAGTIMLC